VESLARVLLALLLVLLPAAGGPAGSPPPVHADASPAVPDPIRMTEDRIATIEPVRLPAANRVCTGATFPVVLRVEQGNLDRAPIPIAGARVEVKDDAGNSRSGWTNGAGTVSFTWPAPGDDADEINLTAAATKEGYATDEPFAFHAKVEDCRWLLKIDYREEYAIIGEVSMVVGAEVHWRGSVRVADTGSESDPDKLTVEGSGDYAFYASDRIQAPIHVSLDPEVAGPYDLDIEGKLELGDVRLSVSTGGSNSFPAMAYLKLTDYTGTYQVNYKPPTPYITTNGAFIEANGLTRLRFKEGRGVITRSSGVPVFFWTDERTAYEITIELTRAPGATP
jgi:hypothetical protein